MDQPTCFAGMDVHRDSVTIALAPPLGPVAEVVTLPHDLPKIKRFFQKVLRKGSVQACYEAGGCGYGLQRSLEKWGIPCHVVAPSLIPHAVGHRGKKTDKRDAINLVIALRSGHLTYVRVPSPEEEQLRALVRSRESLQRDVHAAQQQILKFLQVRGLVYRDGKNWGKGFWQWFNALSFTALEKKILNAHVAKRTLVVDLRDGLSKQIAETSVDPAFWAHKAVARLRCLHGIDTLSAMVIATEIVDMQRFGSPRNLMSWVGLTSSEFSSGSSIRRGGITKAGNGKVRRILIESAWTYQHPPRRSGNPRWEGQDPDVVAFALRAHVRLHDRYKALLQAKGGKVAVTIIARELCGFIWALMRNEPELLRERPKTPRKELPEAEGHDGKKSSRPLCGRA